MGFVTDNKISLGASFVLPSMDEVKGQLQNPKTSFLSLPPKSEAFPSIQAILFQNDCSRDRSKAKGSCWGRSW